MLTDFKENKHYIDYFFKNHRLFFCDSLPWELYNYENFPLNYKNKKIPKNSNLNVRLEYLFAKDGFFNRTLYELNNEKAFKEYHDFSYHFRNRRYIVQELISDNFYNPTHHSFKATDKFKNISLDFTKLETLFGNFDLVTHPGHTRFYASSYLRKNLDKCFIYIHNDNYYEDMFKQKMTEIISVDELFSHWKPLGAKSNNLSYDFVHISKTDGSADRLFKGSKFHKPTDCSVLKLWKLRDLDTKDQFGILGEDVLHTEKYIDSLNDSGKELADTLFERKLLIYTNSDINVKEHFINIRNKLIDTANSYSKENNSRRDDRYNFEFHNVDKFDFDVIVVDKKPENVSELNANKGFVIWIDKDVIEKIDREIFEFLCFTRKDVKLAETKDGNISVVNCRNAGDKKWTIHKEFYL